MIFVVFFNIADSGFRMLMFLRVMVEAGWLKKTSGRYTVTEAGLQHNDDGEEKVVSKIDEIKKRRKAWLDGVENYKAFQEHAPTDIDELLSEIARLKAESAEKDARIRQLEGALDLTTPHNKRQYTKGKIGDTVTVDKLTDYEEE